MVAQSISLKSQIAPHFWQTFKSTAAHQIDLGGRGSTKTSKLFYAYAGVILYRDFIP